MHFYRTMMKTNVIIIIIIVIIFSYYLLILYMYRSMDMQRFLFPDLPLGAEDVGELLEAVDTPVFEKSAG